MYHRYQSYLHTRISHAGANTITWQNLLSMLKDTWHVEFIHHLQPPEYLIIFFNRFHYMNDNGTKSRSLIPLDINIMLGLLQTTIHCGHYTTPANCCGKCSIAMIIDLQNVISIIPLTLQLYRLLYKSIMECLWPDHGGCELINPHGVVPAHLSTLLNTGRGMTTETCGVDDVFPPDGFWFRSDTNTNCRVIYSLWLCV